MSRYSIRRWATMFLVFLLPCFCWGGAGGDAKRETPVASQIIPLRLGSVDAVTGNLSIRMPMGPRLPGRIPLGFTWAYDHQDAQMKDVGGNFKPIVWPGGSSSPMTVTVVVNGEPWMFYKQAAPAAGNMPTQSEFLSLCTSLGADSGAAEAENLNSPNSLITNPQWVYTIAPTTDGRRFFISGYWKIGWVDMRGRDSVKSVAGRLIVLDGNQAIWTALQPDNVHPTGVTYFTNRWGDKASVTESGGSNGAPTTIQIRNERYTSHTITLTLAFTGATFPFTGPSPGPYPCNIAVSNSLGLPNVTLQASSYYALQRYTYVPPGSSAVPQPTGIWDSGVWPTTVTVTPGTGTPINTSFSWDNNGTWRVGRIRELTHPGGLVEHFDYDYNVSRLSNDAYDPLTGYWRGYRVMELENCAATCSFPTQIVNLDGFDGVSGVQTTAAGVSQSFKIARLLPTGQKYGSFAWVEKRHITTILQYPNAAGTGAYRGTRVHHPHVDSWLSSGSTGAAAYVFAASAVVGSEQIHGTALDASGQPSGYVVDGVSLNDGWNLKSWANPTGSLLKGLPVNPIARRTRIYSPGLPTKTIMAGISGGEDAFGPTNTDEFTDPPPDTLPSVNASEAPIWSESLTLPTAVIRRKGTIQRDLDRSMWVLKENSVVKSLDGTSLIALRGVAAANFGTTTTTYGSNGLPATIVGSRSPFTATETRTYMSGQPLITSIRKSLSEDSLGALIGSGSVGTDYSYDSTPFHWMTSETQQPDGRATTYQRDDLGRVVSQTDPMGVTTTTSYDDWGRVLTVARPTQGGVSSLTTTYSYDSNGLWKTEVTSEGDTGKSLTTRRDFDALGRLVKLTLPDGTYQTYGYDGFGQKIAQSPMVKVGQSLWGNEQWLYDERGRLTDHFDSQGRTLVHVVMQPTWTSMNGVTGVWVTRQDDRGYLRSEAVDLLGQKVAVVDQAGQLSTYAYQEDGLLKQTQQGNQVRSYSYNKMGWLISRNEPEEGVTEFRGFTILGNPTVVNSKGRSGTRSTTINTTFNAFLQPAQVVSSGPEGTITRILSYDYGAANTHLLIGMSESQPYGTLTESYGYDGLRRPTSKMVSDGVQSFTTTQALDAAGRVTSLTYPSAGGRSDYVSIAYDAYGRVSAVNLNGESIPRGAMLYDQVNQYTVSQTLTFGNNAWTTTQTTKGELTRSTHVLPDGTVEDNVITWTPGGLMLTRGQDTFAYDALQRLSSAQIRKPGTTQSVAQGFTYDRYGNRTGTTTTANAGVLSVKSEALSWTAAYNDLNDLPASVTSAGGYLYTGRAYDDLGRMTQVYTTPGQVATQTTWVYDPQGRIVQENGTTYLLDGNGLRFKRFKDGNITYTVYGFGSEPLKIFDKPYGGSLSWKRTLVYGFGQLISEDVLGNGAIYEQGDQVGSPNIVSNASGQVVNWVKNLPFGERLLDANPNAVTSARRFTNHEDSSNSNAIYMQARTYLAAYGKFAQVDPAYDQTKDDPESWNLYSYVTNNPVTKTDPDGRIEKLSPLSGSQRAMLANSGLVVGDDGAQWVLNEDGSATGTLEGSDGKSIEGSHPTAQAQTESKNALTAVDRTPFTIAYSPYLLDADTKSDLQGLGGNAGVSVSEIKTQADLNNLAKNTPGNVLLMGHASKGHFYGAKGQPLNVPSKWAASAVALAGCNTSALAGQLKKQGNSGTTFHLYPGRLPLGLLVTQLQSTNPKSFGYYGLSGIIRAWDSVAGRTYPAQELRRTDGRLQLYDISVTTLKWLGVGQ